jgi:hypothetical protein
MMSMVASYLTSLFRSYRLSDALFIGNGSLLVSDVHTGIYTYSLYTKTIMFNAMIEGDCSYADNFILKMELSPLFHEVKHPVIIAQRLKGFYLYNVKENTMNLVIPYDMKE